MTAEEKSLRRKAIALVRRLGVPYSIRKNRNWYDGRRIAAGPAIRPQDILHEAAHWVLAGPHRNVVNFGLGRDPESATPQHIESPTLVDDSVGDEIYASGLGIVFVAMIGGPYEKNLEDHSWDTAEHGDKDLAVALDRAKQAGVEVDPEAVKLVLTAYERQITSYRAYLAEYRALSR